MMRLLVLRHHREDEPGLLGVAFESAGFDVEVHDGAGMAAPPDPEGADAVVVLGSVWSVYDRGSVGDWIDAELEWLRLLDRRGVAVLGVCFGAQALAAAHGGSVVPAHRKEVGWVDLDEGPLVLPGRGPWFEWHADRCIPPPGAVVLASNEVAVQAFWVNQHLGVQFHPELDRAQLARWMDHGGRSQLVADGVDPDELMELTAFQEDAAARRAEGLVEGFLAGLGSQGRPERASS